MAGLCLDVTWHLGKLLDQFAPHGEGTSTPVVSRIPLSLHSSISYSNICNQHHQSLQLCVLEFLSKRYFDAVSAHLLLSFCFSFFFIVCWDGSSWRGVGRCWWSCWGMGAAAASCVCCAACAVRVWDTAELSAVHGAQAANKHSCEHSV